jgi:hypothetical protein
LNEPDAATLLTHSTDSMTANNICYLGAIPDEHSSATVGPEDTVGQYGYQDRPAVVRALCNAPLLLPLESALMWKGIFETQHGSLTVFLNSCGTNELPANFSVLELEPNLHIRIRPSAECTASDFRDAVTAANPNDAVEVLVSILASSGVSQDRLLKTYAGQSFHSIRCTSDSTLIEFVFECLQIMPSRGLRSRLAKLFLEPLSSLVSDYAALMLDCCDQHRPTARIVLHELGFDIGVDLWITDFGQLLQHTRAPVSTNNTKLSPQLSIKPDVGLVSTPAMVVELGPVDTPDHHDASGRDEDDAVLTPEAHSGLVAAKGVAVAVSDSATTDAVRVVEDIRADPELYSQKLGRAMEKLSIELYSKDTHFVLELLQNADDNSYDPDVSPSVEFVISQQGMVIRNNETGFSEANIRAICEVGMSTKGAGGSGFIGQKGTYLWVPV